ncbi:MAG: hypothetical protein D6681_07870 [Calditrichaeota bacterium]|nr:MAG: hypothetical protein D6681_07870 [Calditrichota bacterium]
MTTEAKQAIPRHRSLEPPGTGILSIFLLLSIILGLRLNAAPPKHEKRIRAIRIPNHLIHLDGRLTEPIWQQAPAVTGFRQRDPVEGAPADELTEVRFLYDEDALYVGARMYSQNPRRIIAGVSRRDAASNSERIIISLDTYRDRRTAYSFGVTATGVRVDYYHPEDHEFRRDYSFDPVWEARAHIDSLGWTAEVRIPFSQLRFNPHRQQVWGVNINRWIPSLNEDVYWVYIPKNETGWASRFGELVGLEGIHPGRRIELMPYAAAEATLRSEVDPADPFHRSTEAIARGGMDLKMGLGPNLTLDATVNPDFGQVEADPAEVNLSAFETFFEERRPFFIEGSGLLTGSGPGYFYSRRIGAAPRGEASGDFVDVPDNTTILGAAKLTGRLRSGLSVGALGAITAREFARVFYDSSRTEQAVEVEPLTAYGIVRLQQEFGRDASTAGITLTGVRRDLPRGSPLADILARQAITGGGDWRWRFQGGKYEFSGHLGFSHVSGEPGAIAQIQQSSAHYFQRPDADHVHLDTTRTSLGGYAAAMRFSKNGGRHWLWEAEVEAESPGFELNDLGRLRTADDILTRAQLTYRENRPGRVFHSYRVSLRTFSLWNFGGVRKVTRLGMEFEQTWKNFWNSALEIGYRSRGLSDRMARGGPLVGSGSAWRIEARLRNNFGASTRWNMEALYKKDELDTWEFELSGEIFLRPAHRWELSLNPFFAREVETRQYITTLEDGRPETFGQRYIFSTVDRKTLSLQVRLNYAFTPDLTLELYAEPFAASGRFYNFGELSAPGSRHLRRYGTEGTTIEETGEGEYTVTDGENQFSFSSPDFNRRSFRSNVVLRWEWQPGSTLFLVWQQDRAADVDISRRVTPAALWNTLSNKGNQFLALKVSYWLPVK